MNCTRLLFCCFGFLLSQSLLARGIRGLITDANNQPLPFATIYVEELGTGTSSNAQGRFSYRMPTGTYNITFQYIGYETVVQRVKVDSDFVEITIQLKEQTYELKTVEVTSDGRDPAYIIMRKAITKAPFHLNQLNSYEAEVYTKGSGRVKKTPFMVRKLMEKEGIDSSFAFVSESVSEIYYKRPNYFEEKVISIYTKGDSQNSDPNAYINASFYEPTVADVISPLSPKAFAYYNFTYEGFFADRGREIDKIKITPKSRGENVVEGHINIVDGEWSIHSLDIQVRKAMPANITVDIKQIYAPIENKAWLPVSHQFDGMIKFYGFHFEFGYLATVSNYKIELNPDLDFEVAVIDEKLEKEEAKTIKDNRSLEIKDIEERLSNDKKVTRKELKKLVKEYEKQEQQKQEEPEVISISKYEVDSNAYKRDSIYWERIRPVPLNELEVRGYEVMDSLETVEEEEQGNDVDTGISVGKKSSGFSILDLVFGETYGKKAKKFYIKPTILTAGFNTVDGYNLQYGMGYSQGINGSRVFVEADTRYGFAREKLNYWGTIGLDLNSKKSSNEVNVQVGGDGDVAVVKKRKLRFQVGNNVAQYNQNRPIHPIVNTFMTLLLERNYMKLYEKDFAKFTYEQSIKRNFSIYAGIEWSERNTLQNFSDHRWFDSDNQMYTPNIPINLETTADFETHQATIATFGFETRPWQKYRIRNGRRYAISNSSPLLKVQLRQAIKGIGSGDTNFSHLDLGIQHFFQWGIRGNIDIRANAGFFLNNENMFFPDYHHFLANLTPFVTTDPVSSFRLLDYYEHSTNNAYAQAQVHYQFRKFLVTQIPAVQFLGIKEDVFLNYLATETSQNYFEAGYTIDNLFRFFRLELVTSFQDWEYKDFGIRIGIASNLGVLFNIN